MAQHYKNLIAWQKAMDLVAAVYACTEQFPKCEVYSLTNQIRRAAISVPSNIAEGQAHYNHREFAHYLRHSTGSLAELETQLLIAERLGYLPSPEAGKLINCINELGRILHGLVNSVIAS